MKKWIYTGMIITVLIFTTGFSTQYPANAPWSGGVFLDVQTTQFGRAIIYIPYANKNYHLTTIMGTQTPVNATAVTINGEIFTGAGFTLQRQIRWVRGQTAERNASAVGVAANWQPLTITAIHATNANIANQQTNPVRRWDFRGVLLIGLFVLGGLTLWQFTKTS